MTDPDELMHVEVIVPRSRVTALYAFLGGVAVAAVAAGNASTVDASKATVKASEPSSNGASSASSSISTTAQATASPSNVELDTDGWPWTEGLHASTKTKTADGRWRMTKGASRPEPKPGFGAGASTNGTESSSSASGGAPATFPSDDDEFAAFATNNSGGRVYTDADLGALCNQAATKLGNPEPIREVIAEYMPEGVTAHSRHVPADDRAAFVAAIEEVAGITFAG